MAVYFLAIFHRSSLGVAGLVAADRFHITASQLSTFTVLQLLVYAAMQIPVGVLLDRFGPQRLLVAGTVFMTLAQLGFALTGTYAGALVGPGLRRDGRRDGVHQRAAADRVLVPADAQPARHRVHRDDRPVRCAARRDPAVTSAGVVRLDGDVRASASVGVLLGLLVVLLVRDVPPGAPPARRASRTSAPSGATCKLAWRDPGTRLGLWSHFTTQFAANVMGLLWGYPFFVHAEHRSDAEAAALLSLLVGVFIVGGPAIGGYITRHPWRRSTIVLSPSSARWSLTWTVVLLWPGDAPMWLLAVLVVFTGLGGPGSMIGFDLARTFAPASRLGQASGIVNVGGFTASLLCVLGIGLVLDAVTPGVVHRLQRVGVPVGDVRAVPLLGGRRPAGLALPLPGPRAPRGHPAGDVPGDVRADGVHPA